MNSESIINVATALHAAMKEMAPAVRNAENPHFKSGYVTLDAVINAAEPALHKHGLIYTQQTQATEHGGIILHTRVIHCESGEWLGSTYPVHPVKAGPQNEGSALTYARRYALMAILGMAPEDDDGNAAQAAVIDPAQECAEAYQRHAGSVDAVKDAIARESWPEAVEAWAEIPREDQQKLWLAPTKGGVFTTHERTMMKSSEWGDARRMAA